MFRPEKDFPRSGRLKIRTYKDTGLDDLLTVEENRCLSTTTLAQINDFF